MAAPTHDRSQQDQNREPFAEAPCAPHAHILGPALGAADFHILEPEGCSGSLPLVNPDL